MCFLDKVKNLFTDEVEEEPVKSEVIQVEIPAPVKEEVKEEKIEEDITDNNIVKNEDIDRDEIAIEAFVLNKQANVFIDSYHE